MTENTNAATAAATTTYFWMITLQWPLPGGFGSASLHSTLDVTGPVRRSEILPMLKQVAHDRGVPANADVTYLSIEPDLITPEVAR